MAAHGLTILRQIRRLADTHPDRLAEETYRATEAPGTDIGTGFTYQAWAALDQIAARLRVGDLAHAEAASALDHWIAEVGWMDAYPTLEAVREARRRYAEGGGDPDAFDRGRAPEARSLVTDRYALDQRAPVIA